MARQQLLQVAAGRDPSYAEQASSLDSSPSEAPESPGLPLSPSVFLPRSARASLTHSMRAGSSSPRGCNMFLPGAHRADSIEAMLAAIPSRFNIEKSLSLDSPSSSRASSSRRFSGAQFVPSHVAAVPGMSAIPSRRSRDVPGLQPDTVPLMTNAGPHGDHVTPHAAGNGEMPRTFSGKVRKLKQHRRASASRLRPPEAPSSHPNPGVPGPGQTDQQPVDLHQLLPGVAQRAQQAQQQSSLMPEQAQHQLKFKSQHAQQVPVMHQRPGFDLDQQSQQQLLGPAAEMPYPHQGQVAVLRQHFESAHQRQQLQHDGNDMQRQTQLPRQFPEQLQDQHLQRQTPVMQHSRRHRPSADAAGLACYGKGVQGSEEGRMTQSGPLQLGQLQHPLEAAPVALPELFEAYHVRPRGRGTGTLDRRMASLDRMFQKLPPGETRRRRRLQAVSLSAPALPGTLPCQGSFILTPGTAAIPRELSLNPQGPMAMAPGTATIPTELSLNPQQHFSSAVSVLQSQDHGFATARSYGAEHSHSPRLGLTPSPVVFEFARNPTAAHVSTAKLEQPLQAVHQTGSGATRVQQGPQNPAAATTPASANLGGEFDAGPQQDQGKRPARSRAVRSSLQGGARSPRTSIEDLSQMQSCLSELEHQLVQIPRPASRGQCRPKTAEANTAANRKTPLHMHLQQPGLAALGQPDAAYVNSEAVSFLRPPSQLSHHSGAVSNAVHEAEEGEQRSRPSSAGSVASQPQFAALKARVSARRQVGR